MFDTKQQALLPISRPKTTAEEVEDRLILAIALGTMSPGERITEGKTAAALDVSRMPVREAMQKLQLRGILVGGSQRGLRVLDHSAKRIADLFELRLAIEKIVMQHVMSRGRDNSAMLEDLEDIVRDMADLSSSGDPVALSSIDLKFHRTVVRHSGNELAAQIWEGLAQHLMIIFCADWSRAKNLTGEVWLHEEFVEFLRRGSVNEIDQALTKHFSDPPETQEPRKS